MACPHLHQPLVRHGMFSWEIGASNEQTIRNVVRNSLLGTEGREYYEAARELFKSELGAGNRRDRKF